MPLCNEDDRLSSSSDASCAYKQQYSSYNMETNVFVCSCLNGNVSLAQLHRGSANTASRRACEGSIPPLPSPPSSHSKIVVSTFH